MSTVETISAEETYDLRHRVLRPHQTIIDCQYPGDFTGTTFHLGIRDSKTIVCIGSFYLEQNLEFKEGPQIRLRGMATDPSYGKKGYGSSLLREAEKICIQRSAPMIWCFAREVAFDFYTKAGFQFHGDFFDLPGIGRHKVMFKHLRKTL